MKNTSKPTVLQSLLELQKVCNPEQYRQLQSVIDSLEPDQITKAEQSLKSHRYPDSTLRFVQLGNLKGCPQLTALVKQEPKAYFILMILASLTNQDNAISIKLYPNKKYPDGTSLQEISGLKRETIRNEMEYLRICGFVKIIRKARSHEPGIYAINPQVAKAGSQPDSIFFDNVDAQTIFEGLGKDEELQLGSETVALNSGRKIRVAKLIKADTNLKDSRSRSYPES